MKACCTFNIPLDLRVELCKVPKRSALIRERMAPALAEPSAKHGPSACAWHTSKGTNRQGFPILNTREQNWLYTSFPGHFFGRKYRLIVQSPDHQKTHKSQE